MNACTAVLPGMECQRYEAYKEVWMNPPIERREGTVKMERLVGLLEGELSAIKDSQRRIEDSIKDHMDREEKILENFRDRIQKLESGQWKVVAVVAGLASTGGASLKHFWEKIW